MRSRPLARLTGFVRYSNSPSHRHTCRAPAPWVAVGVAGAGQGPPAKRAPQILPQRAGGAALAVESVS
eukprot:scaffold29383_cov102-Isochrysis_galbana.AAC.2